MSEQHMVSRGASRGEQARFFAVAAIVGLATGTVGTAFHLIVDAALTWPARLSAWLGPGVLLVIAAAVVAAAMAVASAAIVRRFAPEAAGSGIQEVEGNLDGLRPLRWRVVLPVKFVAGVLSLSSGLVLGREGPTIHMGACIGGAASERTGIGDLERRGLIAAGAAAGLAAAFNAPLAAVLFVIEETRRQFPYSFKTYAGVIIAALLSAVVTEDIAGVGPNIYVSVDKAPLWMLGCFLLLGAALGGLGIIFNRMILGGLDLAAAINARVPNLVPLVVGLVIGALLILLPEATMGNESLIPGLIASGHGALFLFGLVAIRLVTSAASYVSGVPGGIFAPMLTLSAAAGLALGVVIAVAIPDAGLIGATFAVAAMGGLFTASVRAPLVGVVLALELTGAYDAMLPIIVTCVTAHVTAEWLGGKPIYEQLLERTLKQAGIERPDLDERTHSGLA